MDIQSKEVIDKISDELKVQPAMTIPRELAKQIQLVYAVNPIRNIRIQAGDITDSASGIMHTTHATKDTWLVACSLSVSKDVNSTSTFSRVVCPVRAQPSGESQIVVRYEPLTANNISEVITFNEPILLKKGAECTVTNSSAVASIDATGTIWFYETDPQ